jgi:beta-glucanase (GH16 family)
VIATGWTTFTFAGVVSAGSHQLTVSSTTATPNNTLYLDKVSTMTGSIADDFTGKYGSAPSDPLWGVRNGSGFDAGAESYSPNNVYLDGQGHLVIQAVRGNAGGYSSGWAWSKNDVSYGHGTITARIKMPKGQGIWPAFWLMGADSDTVGWPASGEIDVVELPSTTTRLYSTLHGPIAGTTATQQAQIVSTLADLSTGYHNYWVQHLPNRITFGVDNQTLGTMTPASLAPGQQWVYNRPMYVNLNVAVGGPWAGAPDATTVFPAKMLVDSVRWDPPA